jgi:DNA-binding NarL/FixJ family response regulator
MIRVLLLSKYPLFNQGIQSLLHDEADLLIVGQETAPDRAEECVRELKPDVVIIDDGDEASGLASEAMRLFREGVVKGVVELDTHSNTLLLCHREDRMAQQIQDLTRAIYAVLPRAEEQPQGARAPSSPKKEKEL